MIESNGREAQSVTSQSVDTNRIPQPTKNVNNFLLYITLLSDIRGRTFIPHLKEWVFSPGTDKGNILAGEGPIVIGDNNFGGAPDFHFVGAIDEVAVYDRVLDQNEIEAKIARGHAASVEPEGKLSTVWAHVKSQYQKF